MPIYTEKEAMENCKECDMDDTPYQESQDDCTYGKSIQTVKDLNLTKMSGD